ncbi:MAG: hypothetical protein ACJ76Y_13510 [Thermoanaerobaculia bacterium]
MSLSPGWHRHRVEPLGLSVELLADLPAETWQSPTGGGVFQTLPEEAGTLFVHWGESASLETFRQSLGDLLTRTLDLAESPTEVLGAAALRIAATVESGGAVAYRRDEAGALSHTQAPKARIRTEVLTFTRQGLPVLVGYRVVEPALRRHRAALRHFLASLRQEFEART